MKHFQQHTQDNDPNSCADSQGPFLLEQYSGALPDFQTQGYPAKNHSDHQDKQSYQ